MRRAERRSPVRLQLHLHDGRLRSPRLQRSDSSARRYARPDGEAVRRNHRDSDHRELPRRSIRAAVLRLDARRRKGLADTALKTANSGYLTRRFVDVAQDVDRRRRRLRNARRHCNHRPIEGGEIIEKLGDRVLGRVALDDVIDPVTNEMLRPGQRGDRRRNGSANRRGRNRTGQDPLRSDLPVAGRASAASATAATSSRGHMVNIGEAVGVIAAQSIGEPGTQLDDAYVPHRWHRFRRAEQSSLESQNEGNVKFINVTRSTTRKATSWS